MLFAPREEIGERGEPWCDDVKKERAFAFMLFFLKIFPFFEDEVKYKFIFNIKP